MHGMALRTTPAAALVAGLLVLGSALIIDGRPATAAPAGPDQNCTLIVPEDPLSARGLATPYQLTATDPAAGPCNEANAGQSAFVEAAVLSGDGKLTTYDPLVIDQGTQPAVAPVPAQVDRVATVGIWFGFNGVNLTLKAADGTRALSQGRCVNGLPHGSLFGQFAYCNGQALFRAAHKRIADHTLVVPAAGTASDGLPCPTVRDFSVVDQDQSDNVVTHYLATADGQTAQQNAANTAQLTGAADLANGSDNLLLSRFIDPALGCAPWTVPDQSGDGQLIPALVTDELSAAADQQAPIALVPLTDPMTVNNGRPSVLKTDRYRQGVDQGLVRGRDRDEEGDGADAIDADDAADPGGGGQGKVKADGRTHTGDDGDGATYCTNLFTTPSGIARVFKDQATFTAAPSVDPAAATNLFTFLAMRAQQSFGNLNCQNLIGTANPVTLTTDGNGVVTDATFGVGGTATTTPATTSVTPTSDAPPDGGTTTLPSTPTTPPTSTDPGSTTTDMPTVTSDSPAPTASVTTDPPSRTRPSRPGHRDHGGQPRETTGKHW